MPSKTTAVWMIVLAGSAFGQDFSQQVAADVGLVVQNGPRGYGNGAAFSDFDQDGLVDIFVPTDGHAPHVLLKNTGGGAFASVGPQRGFSLPQRHRVALWVDYDADGRLDLLLADDCFQTTCEDRKYLNLYRQLQDGTFQDVTDEAGLAGAANPAREQHRSGLAAADLNGDGYLDFVTSFWLGRFFVFINNQDGTFHEISTMAGIDDQEFGYWQPTLLDVDSDGLVDIYAAVDFGKNRLWMNQGIVNGLPTFTDVADSAGAANDMNDMGVAIGDYDADGDPDIYISNIFRDGLHNVLLRNDSTSGVPMFVETSVSAGVDDGGWGWGVAFLDADNDTHLDIAATSGWHVSGWEVPIRLFMNAGEVPVVFSDNASEAGLLDTQWGSALVSVDYDLDGDADLFETISRGPRPAQGNESSFLRLYQNQIAQETNRHGALMVRPRMAGPNHYAVGAKITVETGVDQTRQTRWITAGSSFMGQAPAEVTFGLGQASAVRKVIVDWPGGSSTQMGGIVANRVIVVHDDQLSLYSFE